VRQRKVAEPKWVGQVRLIQKFSEWKEVRDKSGGKPVAVLYVDQGAAAAGASAESAVGKRFGELAHQLPAISFARMEVDGKLDELAKEGVRFAQRFPVMHVYQGSKKIDQVGAGDVEGLDAALQRIAASAPAAAVSAGAGGGGGAKSGAKSGKQTRPAGTTSGHVTEIHSHAEFESVMQTAGDLLVVVDFTATWCGPCKKIKPFFHTLASDNPNVVFLQVDVDECDQTAGLCGVEAMPTFQFYKHNKVVMEVMGADEAKLLQSVAKFQ